MPLVAQKLAEVRPDLAPFEEDVAGESPEQCLAEFHLHHERLVVAEVLRLHAAETLDAVGARHVLEGHVAVGALPHEAYRHGGVPDGLAVGAQVEFLVRETEVAERIVVEPVFPLQVHAVARPVGVVARVYREVVPEGGAPAVRVCGERDFAVVFPELHRAVVDVEHHAVAEELERRGEPEVRFHEGHEEERLAVKADVVVDVDVVADAEEVPHPVLVAEVEPAGDAVVREVKIGSCRELELLARGTVGGDVYLLRVAALERRGDEEVHHRAELEFRFLGVPEHGYGTPPLEMRCVRSGAIGLHCHGIRRCRAIRSGECGHGEQEARGGYGLGKSSHIL